MSRERPVLFSATMIRAILKSQKTQTRRIVPLPRGIEFDGYAPNGDVRASTSTEPTRTRLIKNRYGAAGDRLWVRETWAPGPSVYPFDPFIYRADVSKLAGDDPATADHVAHTPSPHADCYACERERRGFRWRPSIHMPRKASRITLEIVSIRVERLQAISEDDARAEGVKATDAAVVFDDRGKLREDLSGTHRGAFACLWDSINGSRAPWKLNPWVWVVSFKRVQP